MGIFCVSFDVEGSWGRQHLSDFRNYLPLIRKENNQVLRLITLLQKYSIPATWAIVGKLIEKNDYLIRLVTRANHEIACHSFTHADFHHIDKIKAEYEIQSCVAVANKYGITLSSFVFPFNRVGYLEILRKYQFTCFRGMSPAIPRFLFPHGDVPLKEQALRCIVGSMYFPSNRSWGRFLSPGVRFTQAKKGIDWVVKNGGVFHLWTHPIDGIDQKGRLFDEFSSILEYAHSLKKSGVLSIRTMKEIT